MEGREVGFAKGFESGRRWASTPGVTPCGRGASRRTRGFTERARRGVESFGSAVRAFPIDDPLNEEILDILNAVRGKFKTVVALLGMHHEYNPKETTLGLSF